MFEVKPAIEESPTKVALRNFVQSLPAAGIGLVFILIGYTKFNSDPASEWVRIFEQIGLGQWFRIVTGVMQIAGGVLMMPRRTRTIGAVMLGSTMLGAASVDVFIIGSPLVIAPLLLLFLIATVWVTST
jgi:putative oxidoreductase